MSIKSAATDCRPAARSASPCRTSAPPGKASRSSVANRSGIALPAEFAHHTLEQIRVDRRVSNQLRLYFTECVCERVDIDQGVGSHRSDVGQITCVSSLELCQRLTIEIVVIERDLTVPRNELAPLAPSR
jgi:hypothetical protein